MDTLTNTLAQSSVATDIANGIMTIIDGIANKLGVAANAIYPVLLKQAQVEGFQLMVGVAVGFVLIVLGIIWSIRAFKEYNAGNESGIFITMGVIGVLLGCGLFFGCIFPMINAFMNPDYYIAQKIFKMIQNGLQSH